MGFKGLLLGALLLPIFSGCSLFQEPPGKRNRLGDEKSPYLLQHRNNPVWWQPWEKEVLERAQKEKKPIFLSIGYSTCHWCHVMEEESFEKEEVAKVLNEHFIAIKVDREERPDVDGIYMAAVQSMTGRGGWPLSAFLTSEGKPFFGGTYFPKKQFLEILNKILQFRRDKPDILQKQADEITARLKKYADEDRKSKTGWSARGVFQKFVEQMDQSFDRVDGGFGGAPKFPGSMSLMALLRVARRAKLKTVYQMVRVTLDKMAMGGMYDHLGGGFHRYSTDKIWLVPHFEKMLYDNSLLALTYLDAFQAMGDDRYRQVSKEILDYTLKDLTSPEGGFYSAEDADSMVAEKKEKEEGYFYTFDPEVLKNSFSSKDWKKFEKLFEFRESGHFEKRVILRLHSENGWKEKRKKEYASLFPLLDKIREKNPRPFRDDKILASWNGLMMAAMARGYQVLGDPKYLDAARKSADFLKSKLWKNGRLSRRWRDGESSTRSFGADYANLIFGLNSLYEADFDAKWLAWSVSLQRAMDADHWDEKRGSYFRDAGNDSTLLLRLRAGYDGVRPTANSMAALNHLKLYSFTYEKSYLEKAGKIFKTFGGQLLENPTALGWMLVALDYHDDISKEVVVVGKKEDPATSKVLGHLKDTFLPNKVVVFKDASKEAAPQSPLPESLKGKVMKGDQTTVYVCENRVCRFPTTDFDVFQKNVETFKEI